jgi:hypothetical protein
MPVTWKRFAVLVVLAAALGPARSPAEPPRPVVLPLTPFEVLGLVHRGLSDEAVIRQIRETDSTFRLSPADAQMLKSLGVSDRVLAAMADGPPPRPTPLRPPAVPPAAVRVVPAPVPTAPPAGGRPVGNWVRVVGPVRIALKFTEDRLTVTATFPSPEDADATATVTADADYSVNPEGLLYGVITGIDADDPMAAAQVQPVAGHTFSARCRADGDVLTVREVKFLGSGLPFRQRDDEVGMMALFAGGRYERDDGSKPAAPKKAAKAGPPAPFEMQRIIPPTPAPVHQVVGVAPDGRPIERIGIDFNALPPPAPQQLPVPPQPVPTPAQFVTPPVMTAPLPPPPPPLPPGGPRLAGIWVRELDGVQVVLKFTDKRLFAALHLAYAEEGRAEPVRVTFRADADYAVGPDGTIFGVITGTDFTPPKGEDTDTAFMLRMFPGLNGMPFCFRFRIDDGVMGVCDLRFAENGDRSDDVAPVTGRYVRAEKEPAPPKPIKRPKRCDGPQCQPPVSATLDGVTLPSGRYLEHAPQYIPPDPPFPLQRELNTLESAPTPRFVQPREEAPLPRPAPVARS